MPREVSVRDFLYAYTGNSNLTLGVMQDDIDMLHNRIDMIAHVLEIDIEDGRPTSGEFFTEERWVNSNSEFKGLMDQHYPFLKMLETAFSTDVLKKLSYDEGDAYTYMVAYVNGVVNVAKCFFGGGDSFKLLSRSEMKTESQKLLKTGVTQDFYKKKI